MMDQKIKYFLSGLFLLTAVIFNAGCHTTPGNDGQVQSFSSPSIEPEWIRNGLPIEFEGDQWFPQDGIESLLDTEVQVAGEYGGIQFFVDKQDVRPFKRLYTKFARNKFRYFEKQEIK